MPLMPSTEGMTDKQALLVSALLQGHSIPEAGRIAGYAHDSGAYQAVGSRTVEKALRQWRRRVLNTKGRILGINTLIELCEDEDTPASVRFQAAKALAFAPDEPGSEDDDEAQLSEDELRDLAADMERRIRAGETPLVRVRSDASGNAQGSA